MSDYLAEIEAIAANPAQPDFENTIAALERSGRTFDRVQTIYGIFQSTMNTPEFQTVENEMAPKLAELGDKIVQNEKLFKRIAAVYEARDKAGLTAEQKRLVWLRYTDMVRTGANYEQVSARWVVGNLQGFYDYMGGAALYGAAFGDVAGAWLGIEPTRLRMMNSTTTLMEARDGRQLSRLQAQLSAVKLLIIDELGYVPLSQTGAELLFEVFSQRYERGATIVTSNLPFEEWTSVFGSERLTGALLDRLTHHVHILEMNGESYRYKQARGRRRKAVGATADALAIDPDTGEIAES